MTVQGLTRLRRHQFGRQAAHGTKVPATKVYPFQGVPTVDLTWTDPEIDAGSRDITAAPYRGPGDYTAALTDPALRYNTIPLILSAILGGHTSPVGGGAAQVWTHHPESLTIDEPDEFSYEFGDDVLPDWFQLGDGILESLEITGPDGLGPLTTSMTWRFGSASSTGSTDSPADVGVPQDLTLVTTEALVYLKDCGIYIADDVAGLAAGQILQALHTFVLRINVEWDQKRYADGTQTFDISAYGPGARIIELEATFAKTADTVGPGSEADHWFSDEAVDRILQLKFLSTVLAQSPSTFHGWDVTLPARYYTRTDDAIGGNSTVVLMARAFYDPEDFEGVFESVATTTLTEADLGEVGS